MKTPEQIQKMRDCVAKQYADLPDVSFLGADNRAIEKVCLANLDAAKHRTEAEVRVQHKELEKLMLDSDAAYEAMQLIGWVLDEQDAIFESDWGYEE